MTVFLPLEPSTQVPTQPSFLVSSRNVPVHLSRAIQAIMKAKRIVVICGAGISVQAGIPDFRSSEGLFQTIKRDNPKEAMSSGKELFDASVFNSENKTSLFYQMIAQLSGLSEAAQPTAFHNVLRALDNRGRLLRVYTQNIDALEEKSGLSFGVPDFDGKRLKAKSKGKTDGLEVMTKPPPPPRPADDDAVAATDQLPSPPLEVPRCIPLHGTLQSMHCQVCNHEFPLTEHIPSLASGLPPSCSECTAAESARQLIGKRPRKIGRLRPSVVLYNEAHKDGEGVGEVVRKDLIGCSKGKGKSGADLLLVVGTSLKVPGTKRMVREFSKAVKARGSSTPSSSKLDSGSSSCSLRSSSSSSSRGLLTPAASPRRSPIADEDCHALPKSLYLNLDFPVPTREWDGVFDAWIQGDAQTFAGMLQAEIDKEAKMKEMATEKKRKRKREEAAATTTTSSSSKCELPDFGRAKEQKMREKKKSQKHNNTSFAMDNPRSTRKKRKITTTTTLPSPPPTPPRSSSRKTNDARRPPLPSHERNHHRFVVVEPPRLCFRLPARPPVVGGGGGGGVPEVVIPLLNRPKSPVSGECYSSCIIRHRRPPSSTASTSSFQFDKRTKAGRKALRETRKARRAERLAQASAALHATSAVDPIRSPYPYSPSLRTRHQESFVRSSSRRRHGHGHVGGGGDDDIQIDELLPYQLLERTSLLGL